MVIDTDLFGGTDVLYRHIRPDTNEVFYVGQGSHKRRSKEKWRNQDWENVIKELAEKGLKHEVHIIFENLTPKGADDKEIEFIALYGRADLGKGTLTNHTDGGKFGAVGYRHSEESRQKNRERHIGFKHTPESIEKITQANLERERDICIWCKTEHTLGVLKAHHNDFCKKNPNKKIREYKTTPCKFCSKEITKSSLHAHETNCKQNPNKLVIPVITCPHCNKLGKEGRGMTANHFENCKVNLKNLNDVKILTCTHCDLKMLENDNLVKLHFDKCYSNKNRKVYKTKEKDTCKFCGHHTDLANLKLNHNDNCKQNPDRKPTLITCNYCGTIGEKSSAMLRHHFENCKKSPNKTDFTLYKCTYCDYENISKILDKTHNENCKLNPNKYDIVTCPYCNFTNRIGTQSMEYHFEKCKLNPDREQYFIDTRKTCNFCGETPSKGIYGRFHGENCKKNPNRIVKLLTCTYCKITKEHSGAFYQNHFERCKLKPTNV